MGARERILYDKEWTLQPDAYLSQDDPVSATWYPILPTTLNARILSVYCNVDWGVTQPTPLELRVTVDGIPIIYAQANPVSATPYYPQPAGDLAMAGQYMTPTTDYAWYKPFIIEGRSISVDVRITWAVTQPTPLRSRVKWAKKT